MRQIVAPVAAVAVFVVSGGNVAAAAATYSYFATTGANLERGRGFFESAGRGLLAAGATFVGASIGGAIGGRFGIFWEGFGTAVGAGAVGGLLGGIGGNLKGLAAYGRIGAVGAASGAASGSIFGDAGGGAWRGAASAIAAAIAAKSFQAAIDAGRAGAGAKGTAPAEADGAVATAAIEGKTHASFAIRSSSEQQSEVQLKTALTSDQGRIARATIQTVAEIAAFGIAGIAAAGSIPLLVAVELAAAAYTAYQGYQLYQEAAPYFRNRFPTAINEAEQQAGY